MAHAFKITPAKSAFGNIKESIHQSDYIDRVKHKNSSCGRIKCNHQYKSYYKSKQIINTKCDLSFNKNNLESNLFTKQNLKDVCIITQEGPTCNQNNCNTGYNYSGTQPLYYNFTIDPCGQLFGKTQQGVLNFTNFNVLI